MCKCKICGHEWRPRTDKPKACPSCKRYGWDKDKNSAKGGKMNLFYDDKLVSFAKDGFTMKLGKLKFICSDCDQLKEIKALDVTGDNHIDCNGCKKKTIGHIA
ncbi:MAG: hypothetical protein ABIG61_17690 [Planctomycetota bacterium]